MPGHSSPAEPNNNLNASGPTAHSDANIVEIRAVRFSYGPRTILDGVDLVVPRGKITGIMGPSGCGKTTLLNLTGGRLKPTAGAVIVDGQSVPDLNRAGLFALRMRMGMLFQTGALLTDLTVMENVAFPIREHTRLPESIIRNMVLFKLESVGLRGARDLMPSELSGGMARRVALARAIALDPMMVMYDEPFTGLDPISKGVIAKLIRELNDALGISSIVVSHDVAETCHIADYAYLMADGRVVGEGTPKEVLASTAGRVQQFMQGLPDGPVPFHYPANAYLDDLMQGERR